MSPTEEHIICKVGRHRLYSSEQRKDRNRKAQAAFRDRRSQYTKNLETALLEYENKVTELTAANTHLEERAKTAESRCDQLASEVDSLHKLLEIALLSNQHYVGNNIAPLSPIDDNLKVDMPMLENILNPVALDLTLDPLLTTGEFLNNTIKEL